MKISCGVMASPAVNICRGSAATFKTTFSSPVACSNIDSRKRRVTTRRSSRSSARAIRLCLRLICSRCSKNALSAARRCGRSIRRCPAILRKPLRWRRAWVRPHSRGHLELTSSRPTDALAVHANFLDEPQDVQALLRAVELCREIGNSAPVREFARRELMPGPLAPSDMERWLRRAAGTYFHQTCSAKMGRDAQSVVDGSLRYTESKICASRMAPSCPRSRPATRWRLAF